MSGEGVSELMQALYAGDRERADELLAARETLDVFEAAAFGRVGRLGEVLDAEPELATAFSTDGFTALHFAAFFRQPAAAQLLLDRGADPRARAMNPMEVEPLHSAAAANQTEISRMLLDAGADPNARQEGGLPRSMLRRRAAMRSWSSCCSDAVPTGPWRRPTVAQRGTSPARQGTRSLLAD